jgi:hypothetical protein
MFGFRVLLYGVAYVVVLAEMIVGSGATRSLTQGVLWIVPGALVITLLIFVSTFVLANFDRPNDQRSAPTAANWVTMTSAGAFIAATAFYFPNHILGALQPLMLG